MGVVDQRMMEKAVLSMIPSDYKKKRLKGVQDSICNTDTAQNAHIKICRKRDSCKDVEGRRDADNSRLPSGSKFRILLAPHNVFGA
jgi:hypothetical protein